MKINVKKLESGKLGTKQSHHLDEEVIITEAITAPVEGQVVLTKEEQTIVAHFDITVNVNINWEEGEKEASRQQIPLHFDREYLLHAKDDSTLAVHDHHLDTDLAIVPEVKVNLPVQAFRDNIEE